MLKLCSPTNYDQLNYILLLGWVPLWSIIITLFCYYSISYIIYNNSCFLKSTLFIWKQMQFTFYTCYWINKQQVEWRKTLTTLKTNSFRVKVLYVAYTHFYRICLLCLIFGQYIEYLKIRNLLQIGIRNYLGRDNSSSSN